MKFLWTTLQVKDMDVSVAFYQSLIGLKLIQRHVAGPGIELAFLGDGDTQIELVCNKNTKESHRGKGISMGFKVDSLDNAMKMVKEKGIEVTKGIQKPNPYIRFFYVNDPDGYEVQFVEKI